MSSLRRTMAAGFTLDDAVTLDRVQQEGEALLAPLDSLFRQHPAYRIRHPRVDACAATATPSPSASPCRRASTGSMAWRASFSVSAAWRAA